MFFLVNIGAKVKQNINKVILGIGKEENTLGQVGFISGMQG